jgi:TP901 family phage tail tape measure protein
MADPVASVEIQARSRGLAGQLREARAKFGQFADGVATKIDSAFGGAFRRNAKGKRPKDSFLVGAAKHAAGNLMSGAITKSMDIAVDMGKSVLSFEERLTRLKIAAQETPAVMASLRSEIRKVSDTTGVSKDKILAGAEAYVRLTGDMKTAREQSATFAKVAQATNSEVTDIAETAAALAQNLKVPASEFEAMFSSMAAQGKKGAIELKDLATELSTIAPQWAQFTGGTGTRGVRELGAALQIVKRGFGGDAAETVTGLSNFLTAVTKKSGRFKEGGVKSFFTVGPDGKKQLKDVFTIIDQISNSKLAKDPAALTKAFGTVEAYRAYIQLRDNREELNKFVEAGKDAKLVQRDFNEYMSSSSGKIAMSWEQMKNKIAEAFTPERIAAFASALTKVAEWMAKIVGFIDKSVKYAEELKEKVFGKSVEKRSDELFDKMTKSKGHQLAMENMSPTAKREYAAKLRQDAANLYHKKGGMTEDDQVTFNVNQREADQLEAAADEWNVKGAGINADKFAHRYAMANPNKIEKYDAQFVQPIVDAITKQLAVLNEIKSNTGAGTEVKVGADPIAKASKDAPSHRRSVAR